MKCQNNCPRIQSYLLVTYDLNKQCTYINFPVILNVHFLTMAWLQNLAGKAEDLLVKLDQNTANVFNETNLKIVDSSDVSTNIIEPPQEDNTKLLEPDITILVESKNANNVKSWSKSHSFIDCETAAFSDNISIVSERSRLSDNDDGITFNAPVVANKRDTPSPVVEPYSKKEPKSEYSGVSSKSGSLQNSFILMDDALIKYEEKIAKLERENEEFNQQLINMRHLYSETQNENSNLQSQLERANETLAATQNEMEQYRARAQRILQEKEKLIGLKQSDSGVETADDQIMITYNEELKKEMKFQEEKCKELSTKLLKTNNELSVLQQNFISTQKDQQTSKQVLQDSLLSERRIRSAVEEEYRTKTKELQSVLQELSQQNNVVTTKSQEIFQLREQLKQRTNYVVNDDLELRLQNLTQTLMSKQNTLETVTTERNALRLQLEKIENEHHKVIMQIQRSNVRSPHIIQTDEGKSQVPQFMKISPFDAGVTRKVKHAYSSLDAVSIRTGIFLRRYPLARVFVFCYMILLHIWVLIILFTYVPTSH